MSKKLTGESSAAQLAKKEVTAMEIESGAASPATPTVPTSASASHSHTTLTTGDTSFSSKFSHKFTDLQAALETTGERVRDSHSWRVSIIRRLVSCSVQFFGFFNTINMINGQSLMLSQNVLALDYNIFPPDNHNPRMHCDDDGMGDQSSCTPYEGSCVLGFANAGQPSVERFMNGVSVGRFTYPFTYGQQYESMDRACCDTGVAQTVVFCPFAANIKYIIFIVTWCIVWSIVIITQLYLASGFGTDDLRYWISLEQAKTHRMTKFNCWLVGLLSLGGLIFVNYEIADKDNLSVESAMNMRLTNLIATVLNISTILPLLKQRFATVGHIDLKKDYPESIIIHHLVKPSLGNMYGVVLQIEEVFAGIENAMIHGALNDNDNELQVIGDPAALKKVMAEITGGHYAKKENKKEEEEKEKEKDSK